MTTAKLIDFIQRFIEKNEIPGLAAAVIQDGDVLLASGFGVRSIEQTQPVTPTSLFHMASVSKPFSATAIMQLVEKGKMDLDAKLVNYLPYFIMDDERYKSITISQMLNHISGMPDVTDYEWGNNYTGHDALERYARSLSGSKLLSDPGTTFAYSNIAFELLGDVISKVSGLTFEEYMHRNIFESLGMHHSTFLRADVPEEWSVTPHGRLFENAVIPVYPYNRSHAPSSTFHTNAEDACRWMQANLQRGERQGIRILQTKSYDQLWKRYFKVDDDRQIGLSWFIGNLHEYTTIGHGGSDDGFRSQLMMIPEKQIGVTVMCNVNPAPMSELAGALAEICLGYTPAEPLMPVFFPVSKVYITGGYNEAANSLETLRASDRYLINVDHFVHAANQLYDHGDKTRSLEISRLGLIIDPKSAALHAMMALIYHDQQQEKEAKDSLDQALALDSENYIVKYVKKQFENSAE